MQQRQGRTCWPMRSPAAWTRLFPNSIASHQHVLQPRKTMIWEDMPIPVQYNNDYISSWCRTKASRVSRHIKKIHVETREYDYFISLIDLWLVWIDFLCDQVKYSPNKLPRYLRSTIYTHVMTQSIVKRDKWSADSFSSLEWSFQIAWTLNKLCR